MATQTATQPLSLNLFLRSLLFSCGMVVSTMVVASLVILSFAMPFRWRYRLSQLWSRFNIFWLRLTCQIDYQLIGVENIPDRPVVIMAKHQSTWETLFFQQYLPPIAWVIKRELIWIPFFGWAMALLRPIAIDRQAGASAVKQVIRQGVEHLQQGQWVLIFPEGTRVAPGVRKRYGMGGTVLAVRSGCPILPVALNTGKFWPRGRFIKRPGTIQVIFGPLLDSTGHSPQDLTQQVENWIEKTMERIEERSPLSPNPSPASGRGE